MIKIMIYTDSSKHYKGFEIKGHAGYADSGNDIICSAISILSQNTINSIEKFTDDDIEYKVYEKIGGLKFKFKNVPCKESELLMDSMILGIKSIIDEYGEKFLNLSYKEV